jgi:regulator of PEP synthase PpsR (kinase-PPPase family)
LSEVQLPRPIFIVSDGTGGTAEKMVRAGLHQFRGYLVHIQVFPNITEAEQLERLVRACAKVKALLVTTLVEPEMRRLAQTLAQRHELQTVDLLGNFLNQASLYLRAIPQGVPGRMHQTNEDYFRRIEAVEFTVKADDGKEARMLKHADIVLVGISRTSKTPLSVFLAHKGYKVSNVPVVLDRPLPDPIFAIDQRRIFGLTIDPECLMEIRRQRLVHMRVQGRSNYGDIGYILAELEYAENLFRKHREWPVIDVTNKAVEETAGTLLRIMGDRGLGRDLGEVGQL